MFPVLLMVLTEYKLVSVCENAVTVFHIAYLLHGSTQDTIALVIRNLNRAQKLDTEGFNPCRISFHTCSM